MKSISALNPFGLPSFVRYTRFFLSPFSVGPGGSKKKTHDRSNSVPYPFLNGPTVFPLSFLYLIDSLIGAEINTPENAEAFLGLIQHKEEVSPILEYLLKKGFDPNQLQEGRLLSVALEKHNSHMVRLYVISLSSPFFEEVGSCPLSAHMENLRLVFTFRVACFFPLLLRFPGSAGFASPSPRVPPRSPVLVSTQGTLGFLFFFCIILLLVFADFFFF
jgi:hypothetical protein